jgi:hypothetical protein
MTSLDESFGRIEAYSERLAKSLPFRRTQGFARAILLPVDQFEALCVREGEPHEAALFQTSSTSASSRLNVTQQLERMKLRQSLGGTTVPSALGPRRRTINPQATVSRSELFEKDHEIDRQFKAVQKLLDV